MLCYVVWLKRSFVFSLRFAFCSQLRDGRLVILRGCSVWYLTPYTCNSISEGQVSCIFRGVERDVNKFVRKVCYLSARVQNVTAVTSNTLWYCCSMQSRLHPAVHLYLGLCSFHNISIHLSHGILRTRVLSAPYTSSWLLGWLIQILWATKPVWTFWRRVKSLFP
jgi:hypothetical protein